MVSPHLPLIQSWESFKKRTPDIPRYSYMDGTLRIKYTVEPTMRNLGFYQVTINEMNTNGIPLNVDTKPKQFVKEWFNHHPEYHHYKECIYYVWYVRRERATRCVDLFLR